MVEQSDIDIIRRVRAGEREAYADLVRRHHPKILQLCRSMVGGDYEDAAQAAFIKAYERLASYREDAAFASWLYRVAANVCLDLLRKKGREKTVSLDGLQEELGPAWEKAVKAPDEMQALERSQLVEALMQGLDPDYRLVLVLREVEGLSYEEIAQRMEWSLDSVKAKLKRARKKLAELARHFSAPGSV